MALRSCPVCGGSSWAKEFSASPPEADPPTPMRLVECSQCRLVYMPSPPSVHALYSKDYYGKRAGLANWIFEPFNRFWTRRKARRLIALGASRSWLDYGCGRGDLLEALAAEGANIWGIETQPDCVQFLSGRWKGKVGQSLQDLHLPTTKLEGVSFYHVLEHLENPKDVLIQLHSLVSPHALLFVAVPNWDAWERSWFGDRWFHLDVPRHQLHFTPASLSYLLEQTGWKMKKIKFKITAYDLFGLFQSLLNLGPGPRNYFYRRFKRGESFNAKDQGTGLLWTLFAALPAAGVALLVTPWMAAQGRLGTFEAVADA